MRRAVTCYSKPGDISESSERCTVLTSPCSCLTLAGTSCSPLGPRLTRVNLVSSATCTFRSTRQAAQSGERSRIHRNTAHLAKQKRRKYGVKRQHWEQATSAVCDVCDVSCVCCLGESYVRTAKAADECQAAYY